MKNQEQIDLKVHDKEEKFHDDWSHSVNPDEIDVVRYNTAYTLPEIRHVNKMLKNSCLRGGGKFIRFRMWHGRIKCIFCHAGI
jgi:hypothetical protein